MPQEDQAASGTTRAPAPGYAAAPRDDAGSGRTRFLRACACCPVDITPVWLMRQAGRVLPEYRRLKERHSFLDLVRTPELAAEVTLQPIHRFAFDAAIIFSDILVIPEALGQGYHFADTGGVRMDFPIATRSDIERLEPECVVERLQYVAAALRLTARELDGRAALIGFSGSPWTLANFMLEGGSSHDFKKALHLFQTDRSAYDALAERLTAAIIDYLRLQCEAGAEVIQLFDTLAGTLPGDLFEAASGRWLRDIVAALGRRVPVILFCKGAHSRWTDLVATGAEVIGVDSSVALRTVADRLPAEVAVQGNLEPQVLTMDAEIVRRETRAILEMMRGRAGHIFNLGHGVPPSAALENIEMLTHTIRGFA